MSIELNQNIATERKHGAVGIQEATIRGRLTVCDRPAVGFRVAATEVLSIGFRDGNKPCRPLTRLVPLGSVLTDSDGRFAIRFTPSEPDEFACSFSAKVRLQAFDGNQQVWRSADRKITSNMISNAEILPGCTPGSTLIRVLDDQGNRVKGAEIFVNGLKKGTTVANGQVILKDLAAGDTLAARLRLHENATSRQKHSVDSQKNWNYRVYITSVPVLHDTLGNSVQLPLMRVADPTVVQELRLSRSNTMIGFNLTVSVEWAATQIELITILDRLLETSELLYNATDGQFIIERLEIADNAKDWSSADVRILANQNQGSEAALDGIAGSSGRVSMNPYDSLFLSGVFLHEFGHYIFGMRDEYKEGEGWNPANGPVRCTLASTDPTAPFGNGFEKDACVMNGGTHFTNLKKFCSGHPANAHVDGTLQGKQDCWTALIERFSKVPDWRIFSPNSRGAIVSRLPDSGVPIGTATTPPPGVAPVLSCIPVMDWKPKWHVRRESRANERPGLVARTVFQGSPVDDVRVTLKDSDDHTQFQGVTRALTLLDGTVVQAGEILVRGAHNDDSLHAIKRIGPGVFLAGSAVIRAGGPGEVVIPLTRVEFPLSGQHLLQAPGSLAFVLTDYDPAAEPLPRVSMMLGIAGKPQSFAAFRSDEKTAQIGAVLDLKGDQRIELQATLFDVQKQPHLVRMTTTVYSAVVESELHAYSFDGRFEVLIPAGGLAAPLQLAIEEILFGPMPELAEGDRLLAGPYRISSTQGDALQKPGMLYINASGVERMSSEPREGRGVVELLEYEPQADAWQPVPYTYDEATLLTTARLQRLGTYTLVERKP